ncbi:MAG: DUF3857 domain-containing protein [Mucilaginibacter sp.]
MKILFVASMLLFAALSLKGQVRGFGNIDTADLKLSSCEFEKDANAEVLFDRGRVQFSIYGELDFERFRRVKIFNEKGKEHGTVKIEYDNMYGVDHIYDVEAQTINLENGKIVVSKIDPKLMYAEHTDKNKDAIVLTFPNVKAGSVIEYRYRLMRNIASNFPAWYFQGSIPTRYSEFDVIFSSRLHFNALTRISKPLTKDTVIEGGHQYATVNLQSSQKEEYMRSSGDARDNISLLLTSVQTLDGRTIQLSDTWAKAGKTLANQKDYYKELDQHLSGEDTIIKRAALLKDNEEKVAYIFNTVKSIISWNGYENWGSKDGIKSAWKKRVGNSAEVNAILYHLLKRSGVKAYPMLVSSRENGLLQPDFVNIFQINNLVTYVPVDTGKYYLLDATSRYNTYNQVPYNFLNSYGLCLNKENEKYDMIFIAEKGPSRRIVAINASIDANAMMQGTAEISSGMYNRTGELELYKMLGEKKFIEHLTEGDNNIKISALKLQNSEIDTLPLMQTFAFTYELNNSDKYILFNPNIFTSLHTNPFLSEKRSSQIDFGYEDNQIIYGRYKLPAGYKIESLPKNATIVMPDKSIRFKRVLEEDSGDIVLHYEISIRKTRFIRSEYPDVHEFYKKMYEMLNEQIILKKS